MFLIWVLSLPSIPPPPSIGGDLCFVVGEGEEWMAEMCKHILALLLYNKEFGLCPGFLGVSETFGISLVIGVSLLFLDYT